jgi:hypothetical protein
MRGAFVLTFLYLAFIEPAQAACHTYRWQSKWGTEMNAYMETDGAACRTWASRMGGTSEVHSVNIASPASHGTASVSGRTVTYRPRPGFKGEDSFVFALVGQKDGRAERATIRVSVAVR